MAVRTEIQDRRLTDLLGAIRARGRDLTAPMRTIGRTGLTRIQQAMRQEQSPYGEPWEPTLRGGQMLRLTNRLRSSIDYQASADSVAWGTNVLYAGVHQFGATIRARRAPYLMFRIGRRWVRTRQVEIPARPYLPTDGLPDAWVQDMLAELQRHVLE